MPTSISSLSFPSGGPASSAAYRKVQSCRTEKGGLSYKTRDGDTVEISSDACALMARQHAKQEEEL